MQGTIVMLMALSGLGCHHRDCAPVVATGCYDSGYSGYAAPMLNDCAPCAQTSYVAPSCYSGSYSTGYSGSYSAGYSSCYSQPSSSCYAGGWNHKRHGLFGWLCGHRRSCDVCDVPVSNSCGCNGNGSVYGSDYAPAVFGSYTPVYGSGQVTGATTTIPAATLEPAAPTAPPTPATVTTPPPPPAAAPAVTTPPAPPAPAPPPTGSSFKSDLTPPPPAPVTPSAVPSVPKLPTAPSLPSVAPPPVPSIPKV